MVCIIYLIPQENGIMSITCPPDISSVTMFTSRTAVTKCPAAAGKDVYRMSIFPFLPQYAGTTAQNYRATHLAAQNESPTLFPAETPSRP